MFEIDVNSDDFVRFTNKLEKLSNTALPKSVKGTLNGLAIDVKKNTMPESVQRNFTQRQKNFFKFASRINFAKGNNINDLESQIGFRDLGGKNQAIEDLEKQEHGGIIKGRSFIATDKARVSKNKNRIVTRRSRLSTINNIVRVNNKSDFAKSVHKTGRNGHVLYKNMLFRVDNIRGRNFKLSAIYSFKEGRSVKIKSTHFMKNATIKTMKKAPRIWIKEAKYHFEKHFKL